MPLNKFERDQVFATALKQLQADAAREPLVLRVVVPVPPVPEEWEEPVIYAVAV